MLFPAPPGGPRGAAELLVFLPPSYQQRAVVCIKKETGGHRTVNTKALLKLSCHYLTIFPLIPLRLLHNIHFWVAMLKISVHWKHHYEMRWALLTLVVCLHALLPFLLSCTDSISLTTNQNGRSALTDELMLPIQRVQSAKRPPTRADECKRHVSLHCVRVQTLSHWSRTYRLLTSDTCICDSSVATRAKKCRIGLD